MGRPRPQTHDRRLARHLGHQAGPQAADKRWAAPGAHFERRQVAPLLEDVLFDRAEPLALVEHAQPFEDGGVGRPLQLRIERRVDLQAFLVEGHLAVLRVEITAHLLDEVRRDIVLLLDLGDDHRQGGSGIGRLLRELVLLHHPAQDQVAAGLRSIGVANRRQRFGALHQPGEQGRLLERHLLRRLSEVVVRRRLDAITPVAHVDLVAVEGEDFVLGERLFDLQREDHLLQLAPHRLLRLQEERTGELLGERAAPLRAAQPDHVGDQGAGDPPGVDPDVRLEARVLGGDQGVEERRRHLVEGHHDPLLGAELVEDLAVGAVDRRHHRRLPILKAADLRDVEGQEVAEPCTRSDGEREGGGQDNHQAAAAAPSWPRWSARGCPARLRPGRSRRNDRRRRNAIGWIQRFTSPPQRGRGIIYSQRPAGQPGWSLNG